MATISSSVINAMKITPTVAKSAASGSKILTRGSFFDPESQKAFLDKHQQKNTPKITTCSTWSSMNSNSKTSEKWFLTRVNYWSVNIHTAFNNINVQATLKNKIMCTWHSYEYRQILIQERSWSHLKSLLNLDSFLFNPQSSKNCCKQFKNSYAGFVFWSQKSKGFLGQTSAEKHPKNHNLQYLE